MTTYILTTTVGKIRLLIGDTDTSDAVFTDAEITYFYSEAGSIYGAAALALRAWAAKYSANADAEKIGDYSYSQKTVDHLLKQAGEFETKDASTPYFTWSEPDYTAGSGITAESD